MTAADLAVDILLNTVVAVFLCRRLRRPYRYAGRILEISLMEYDVHPIAELFPMMPDDEIAMLKADIEQNGQRDPVILYEGMILDGRHRAYVCEELGRPTKTENLPEGDDPIAFVLSKNIHRRNLTQGQKAVIIVAANVMQDEQARAKERQREGRRRPKQSESEAKLPQVGRAPQARDRVAARAGVSARYIQDAMAVQRADPILLGEVVAQEKSLPEAVRIIRQREADELLESVEGIVPEASQRIRRLPIARNIGQLQSLAKMDPDDQVAAAELLERREATFVTEAEVLLHGYRGGEDEPDSADDFTGHACHRALAGLHQFHAATLELGLLDRKLQRFVDHWNKVLSELASDSDVENEEHEDDDHGDEANLSDGEVRTQ